MLRDMESINKTRRGWRVYGEKTNTKTGITRRYYKCTLCHYARHVVMHSSGTYTCTKYLHPHATSCSAIHHP